MLWRNFVASVWVLIGWCAWRAGAYLFGTTDYRELYGPFASGFALWPFAVGFIELMLWFGVFRHRGSGTRVMATFVGLALLLRAVAVPLITANLYGMPLDPVRFLLYLYVSVSHLAIVAKRPSRQDWDPVER